MKLSGIDCQIPSNKIFNEDIVELVKYHSHSNYNGNINDLETYLRRFLVLTGIESRFWRAKSERPIDFINAAVDNALKMANLSKDDIDLVLYSSIDRAYLEPANASVLCKSLDFANTRNFDIVDACMGWASAVQVAESFLYSNTAIRAVLIINAEFPMDDRGAVLPKNFILHNKEELQWKLPSFTLGEGASASIFQRF
jgi:acyl-CoA:acyl-CoA alkyltransferase